MAVTEPDISPPVGTSGYHSLRRISAETSRTHPVFIVGEARSGTSILSRTLQKHPSFRPREINLVETDLFASLRRVFLFRPGYPEQLIRFMLGDQAAYAAFLHSIRVPRLLSALAAGPNYLLRDRAFQLWWATLSPMVVRSYFFHAARARGCHRLVEKTPTNTAHLGQITDAFPRARLLYIHRHPIDVFGSYRRRAADDPDAGWAVLSPGEFCRRYAASAGRVLEWLAAGHTNLLLVSYEQLTSRPAEALRAVCAFLEEPFDERMLDEPDPEFGRWRGDPHLWGRIVPVTKRREDFVTAEEAGRIQQRLATTMAALGYEPYEIA